MGVVWSSPYRWQILVICLGLLVLTTGFVLLLLSIGLENDKWRLIGGVSASMGSALVVIGTCWCVWVVRRGRYGDGLALTVPDCEAETLTSDAAWRGDFEADDDDDESGVDDDDDDDEEEEDGEEEEEEESEVDEVCETENKDRPTPDVREHCHSNRENKSREKTKLRQSLTDDDEATCLIPV